MLVYVEFGNRLSSASIEEFHAESQEKFVDPQGDDHLILNLARTWRLGPTWDSLSFWANDADDLKRLDTWDAAVDPYTAPLRQFRKVTRIVRAGFYKPLFAPAPGNAPFFYIEFTQPRSRSGAARLTALRRRAEALGEGIELVAGLERIGMLGPDPGDLVIWGLDQLSRIERFSAAEKGSEESIEVAGVYARYGKEYT